MNIRRLQGLPKICSDPISRLAFYVDEAGQIILIFEASRDFLSTPKNFIEVRAQLDSGGVLCTGGGLLTDAQHEHITALDYACYCLIEDDDNGDEAYQQYEGEYEGGAGADSDIINHDKPISFLPRHYVIYSPHLMVEFFSQDVAVYKSHFHYPSPKAVLAQVLSEQGGAYV